MRTGYGRWLEDAGLVFLRQRPGCAKGVMLITIEDESGIANLVVGPKTFEKFRGVVLGSTMFVVRGSACQRMTAHRQISVSSARSSAYSTSTPRYRAVFSILEWPSSIWMARCCPSPCRSSTPSCDGANVCRTPPDASRLRSPARRPSAHIAAYSCGVNCLPGSGRHSPPLCHHAVRAKPAGSLVRRW